MNLTISGHHLEITPAIRDYVSTKLDRVKRHFDHVINVTAIMRVDKLVHKVEASLHVKGHDFHAHSEDGNMYAAIDNTVVVPSYTRADAAVFYSLTERLRLQVNVENLLDRRYYVNADSNTNISPGFPRAVRIGLTARF